MHVIGHDDPAMQFIALAVEMQKCALNHLGNARGLQPALASTGIKTRLDAVVKYLIGDPPQRQFAFPMGQPGLRQRSGQPKRDELRNGTPIEVRWMLHPSIPALQGPGIRPLCMRGT